MSVSCPLCGSADAAVVDRRPQVPTLLNRVYATHEMARAAPRGTLDIRACKACGFAWNCEFDPDLIVYDASYENDQTHSPAFHAHVRARAAAIVAALPAGEPIDFVEIGCGQGLFIGELMRAAGTRLHSAEGFDPAWRGKDGEGAQWSRIHKVYFDVGTARRLLRKPNAVATRHTIEHVPRPLSFLSAIREALGPDSRARLFVETPSIEWILKHGTMQDFFYEHCSIFSTDALRYALEKSGFHTVKVESVFGGQYLWAQAEAADAVEATLPARAGVTVSGMERERFTAHWRKAIESAREAGSVAIWGAGAKGVTFALLTDPDNRLIDHAIDINPEKQNLYLAGSGLRVLSPRDAAGRAPKTVFVMNSNYLDEIRQIAADARLQVRLIPID